VLLYERCLGTAERQDWGIILGQWCSRLWKDLPDWYTPGYTTSEYLEYPNEAIGCSIRILYEQHSKATADQAPELGGITDMSLASVDFEIRR
jgi:hypothetical protein